MSNYYPSNAANPPTTGVAGCDECNRGANPKPWPIFTVTLWSGVEVCAKCLTPMTHPRRPTVGQSEGSSSEGEVPR